MTPYQRHREKWINCQRCELSTRRKKVVLVRGKLPAPILFIGEAPGASEDVIGRPFVGPAGKLLDKIIEQAIDGQHDYAMTNLVACIPLGTNGKKAGEPPKEAIVVCHQRLQEIAALCKPRLIVCVGKLASKYTPTFLSSAYTAYVDIVHPAAILRMGVSQRGLAIQRTTVMLEDAILNNL